MIPVYITSFNNLTVLRQLVDYILKLPVAIPIIVDNASTYPPLLEWFRQTSIPVIRLKNNLGPRAAWQAGVIRYGQKHRRFFDSKYYVVTDFDLDMSLCPLDVLEVLIEGLNKHQGRRLTKVGVGFEINDLPTDAYFREEVIAWESRFWETRIDDRFFVGGVDTTFAIYPCEKPPEPEWFYEAIRTDRPYVARHVPWYYTPNNITDEIRYYYQEARKTSNQPVEWTGRLVHVIS